MATGNVRCLLLSAACICAAIFGAGCLGAPGSQDFLPPTPGEIDVVPGFQVAEADASLTLTRLIEEWIAENPDLAGYSVDMFYNGTPLEVVESSSCHRDDGTPTVYVHTFRYTMPSLKDPEHMQDDVTLQITVVDGAVTERLVSMGSISMGSSVTVTGV
ncbi:hypothetical protein [Methanogenium organophilum]|uniref:Lipoprotein n=1 Tax=Methanogenium organophilum TaxID=2199 RepID=A0A9X9T7P9_METOG|nr:hypothetical protein [Methanogenium organophilum]WAI00626.1 hypothetical protein OU421_09345 [Methanogenium organophilum]